MYPQISLPDLKYQLKLFDIVVDIVDIDVYVDVDEDVNVNVLEEKWGEGPRWVFLVRFLNPLAFGLPKFRQGPCLGFPGIFLAPSPEVLSH